MTSQARRHAAFTIVEILVVVGVLGLLVAIILPALAGAARRSAKLSELSRLRQVGVGWLSYAAQNDDRILPGYISVAGQKAWRLKHHYPSGRPVPPAPQFVTGSIEEPKNIAGPWAWRLLPLLDFKPSLVLGHRGPADMNPLDLEARAGEVRNEPAFSYNAYYVGGWWDAERVPWLGGSFDVIEPLDPGDSVVSDAPPRRVRIVSQALGSVRRPARLLAFTTAASREDLGVYRYQPARDDVDGNHYALAPWYFSEPLWGAPTDGPGPTPELVQLFDRSPNPRDIPDT